MTESILYRGYFGEDDIEGSDQTDLDRTFEEVMNLPIWQKVEEEL